MLPPCPNHGASGSHNVWTTFRGSGQSLPAHRDDKGAPGPQRAGRSRRTRSPVPGVSHLSCGLLCTRDCYAPGGQAALPPLRRRMGCFAHTGDPSHSGLQWPRFTADARETMVFDVQSTMMRDHPMAAERKPWLDIPLQDPFTGRFEERSASRSIDGGGRGTCFAESPPQLYRPFGRQ